MGGVDPAEFQIVSHIDLDEGDGELQEWGRTVARFSFGTYDLFLSG